MDTTHSHKATGFTDLHYGLDLSVTLYEIFFFSCTLQIRFVKLIQKIYEYTRLASCLGTCTIQFLQMATYELKTTLVKVSGNFRLHGTSKTNLYSSEYAFMDLKFLHKDFREVGYSFLVCLFKRHMGLEFRIKSCSELPPYRPQNSMTPLKFTLEEL